MSLEEAIKKAKKVYPIVKGYTKIKDYYVFSCSETDNKNKSDNNDIWIKVSDDKTEPYYPFYDLHEFSNVMANYTSI